MTRYVGRQREGIISTIGPDGAPQAAYLAIASTDDGELVFDSRPHSRKIANIRLDPRVAVVIGGADGTTLQGQGIADLPENEELERCIAAYVGAFPEFESSVNGDVVFVRVSLDWARYGDYRNGGSSSLDVELTSTP